MHQRTRADRLCRRGLPLFGLLVMVAACRTAPMTGRKQLMLMPESHEVAMGISAYDQLFSQERPSTDSRYIEMVNRVGQRIARVANRPDYEWEFRVIDSPEKNALALPGGKVAVHEGIMPICANEAGLAVVMSHEIAHVLIRHGGERMSQGIAVHGVESMLSYILRNQEKMKRDQVLWAYGVGSKYGFVLPYSRKHELEADRVGLTLMAQAGYDPREAPRFWERFAASQSGARPLEFLSTHPTDARRVRELHDLLADAMRQYERAAEQYGRGAPIAPTAHGVLAGPPKM